MFEQIPHVYEKNNLYVYFLFFRSSLDSNAKRSFFPKRISELSPLESSDEEEDKYEFVIQEL